MLDRGSLEDALTAVGDLLADRGHAIEVVAIGGGSLLLYGGLAVRLASRYDQVCFKLYAAADNSPRSKHFADLKELAPSADELRRAARWTITHDPSEGFHMMLSQVLAALGVEWNDA
ncbi:MAG TPA: hypothetical protein VH165_09250 [Kofleriaceae bacterium]|jgi:hypothetical protein|nr:hypothetical protein [Kofleriaceae bacterium]